MSTTDNEVSLRTSLLIRIEYLFATSRTQILVLLSSSFQCQLGTKFPIFLTSLTANTQKGSTTLHIYLSHPLLSIVALIFQQNHDMFPLWPMGKRAEEESLLSALIFSVIRTLLKIKYIVFLSPRDI